MRILSSGAFDLQKNQKILKKTPILAFWGIFREHKNDIWFIYTWCLLWFLGTSCDGSYMVATLCPCHKRNCGITAFSQFRVYLVACQTYPKSRGWSIFEFLIRNGLWKLGLVTIISQTMVSQSVVWSVWCKMRVWLKYALCHFRVLFRNPKPIPNLYLHGAFCDF